MLIGDAAGLINPLNGEGIQHALQSARWAAEVLAHVCTRTIIPRKLSLHLLPASRVSCATT
jgi:flavin-dependent dehydrogenase